MRGISIISFTGGGKELSKKVRAVLEPYADVELYHKSGKYKKDNEEENIRCCEEKTGVWAGEQFKRGRGILFIGACGIAVRAAAPWLEDKLSDVPVLVMDEAGRFVIPVLCGHYGGANEMAERIAGEMGAVPVITTATDVNGRFAPDVFAVKNGLAIGSREGIKEVSAAVLRRETVFFMSEGPWKGKLPEALTYREEKETEPGTVSILVSPYRPEKPPVLWLCPKAVYIGIGCRRGKTLEDIETAVQDALGEKRIPMEAVAGIASIDLKKKEEGLCRFAKKYCLPFRVFSGEELKQADGSFTSSVFVKEQTGVDNVCERAAIAACGKKGRLVLRKYPANGITVAAAEKEWSVVFDGA